MAVVVVGEGSGRSRNCDTDDPMTASWVWGGTTFPHWLVQVVLLTFVGWVVSSLFLVPAWKEMKDWFDPTTKGGFGDVLDNDGVPSYQRWEERKEADD